MRVMLDVRRMDAFPFGGQRRRSGPHGAESAPSPPPPDLAQLENGLSRPGVQPSRIGRRSSKMRSARGCAYSEGMRRSRVRVTFGAALFATLVTGCELFVDASRLDSVAPTDDGGVGGSDLGDGTAPIDGAEGGGTDAGDPDLVARWTFDEGSGTIAHDSSGHGNDGT